MTTKGLGIVLSVIGIAFLVALLLGGCAEAPSEPVAQAVDAPALNRCPEGNYYARLRPENSTELRLPASIYDGESIYIEFSIRYRGNFNGEGHAYGRHWTWDWKLHSNYTYYRDFAQNDTRNFIIPGTGGMYTDGEWHRMVFRRIKAWENGQPRSQISLRIDGKSAGLSLMGAYNPNVAEQRVLAFKSMDADIDDLFIVVDGKRVGWWDFEGNFVNEAGYGGYEFFGFEIVPYAGEQRYDG